MVTPLPDSIISNDEYFRALQIFLDNHLNEIERANIEARHFFLSNPNREFYVRTPTLLEQSGLYGSGVDVAIISKSAEGIFLPTLLPLRPPKMLENTDEFATRLLIANFFSEEEKRLAKNRLRRFYCMGDPISRRLGLNEPP
jgi:hypothetical protein